MGRMGGKTIMISHQRIFEKQGMNDQSSNRKLKIWQYGAIFNEFESNKQL